MKKTLASIALLSLAAPLALANSERRFDDVPVSHANYVAIEYLAAEGVLLGYGDGTFLPEKTVNRAELAKILTEGQGLTLPASEGCFPDVEEGDWFVDYVCYGAEMEWWKGYEDGNFQPGNTVSKSEAIKMLVNALDLVSELPEEFDTIDERYSDIPSYAWYAPYIEVVAERDLPEVTEGEFAPNSEMTRGGIAEYLFRGVVVSETQELVDTVDGGTVSFDETAQEEFLVSEGSEELVPSGELEISNVNNRGEEENEADEYVELTNFSNEDFDLTGYQIRGDRTDEIYEFGAVVLPAGESLRVYTNMGEYSYGSSEPIWSNSSDNVFLTTPNDKIHDMYIYTLPGI